MGDQRLQLGLRHAEIVAEARSGEPWPDVIARYPYRLRKVGEPKACRYFRSDRELWSYVLAKSGYVLELAFPAEPPPEQPPSLEAEP